MRRARTRGPRWDSCRRVRQQVAQALGCAGANLAGQCGAGGCRQHAREGVAQPCGRHRLQGRGALFARAHSAQEEQVQCAGFQAAVTATLEEKTRRALGVFAARHAATTLAVAGGVAANRAIRAALESVAAAEGFAWLAPPASLCTDNGAIIAWAAAERMAIRGPDALDLSARPRWPLDADAAPMLGSGRKGAKA